MFKKNKIVLSGLSLIAALAISACASDVKKADIPNTANPQEEIAKLDSDINAAVLKNVDVLAQSDFDSTVKWLREAKSDLSRKQKQEEILEDVRKGRGFLNKAYSVAGNRESKATTLFEARQAALTAGAGTQPELRTALKDVDSDVSYHAENLEAVSADKLVKYQDRYIDLERRATVLTQLANAQAIVNGAKEDGASRKAPQTFKKTELSLKNAESVISTNVRNPSGYQAAVTQANEDAGMLLEVMTTIKQNGKNLPESAAVRMVTQNRQIKSLKTTLTATEKAAQDSAAAELELQKKNQELATTINTKDKDLETAKTEIDTTKKDLSSANQNLNTVNNDLSTAKKELTTKEADLSTAKASVEMQAAIEKARQQFSTEEAEAYQQGKNLLIRLKKVGFASGRAELSGASLPMLAKVSEVAKTLKAAEIKVEGHTDSTGTPKQNKAISEERAKAVATYLKSNGFNNIDVQAEGYGFDKPIATNKSKEGRAQNRRVDIIITPQTSTTK